ncbi:MAG: hypothetical protein KGS61_05995, partial [Verrucomicrobia bacterium]|nr:hypothetical protein [Verrucomicrobiota bacterium]
MLLALLAAGQVLAQSPSNGSELRRLHETRNPGQAALRVHVAERAAHPIPRFITGKFAEHLGFNIYNGMDAQVLRNPTFADYPFWTGEMTPDGITKCYADNNRINQEIRRQATRFGWPESALGELVAARADGLACFWTREGEREAVQVSPDTGVHGGRAQRVQVRAAGQGVAQWVYLPLHRERRYEFEILARSPDITSLTVRLTGTGGDERRLSPALSAAGGGEGVGGSAAVPHESPRAGDRGPQQCASATVNGLSAAWKTFKGMIELRGDSPRDAAYKLALTANDPGQLVIGHMLLRPADHIHGADPDIVRLLKESHLPLLRWPGGNFA